MKVRNCILSALGVASVLLGLAAPLMAEDLSFNSDIRPILSDKCFYCHGPDEATREADLRLDSRSGAEYVLDSGDLIDRISSADADMVMPPPESKLSLSDTDKATLKAWVEQGAKYDTHWAFELLPESVSVPEPANSKWQRQTLDRFVQKRIEDAGLKPAAEADPNRWLRRATLDLTGLPPTPSEIVAFEKAVEEMGESAYEEATQRLLASKSFGEHMSVSWLDAARYADSYGYQSDKLNTQWPYRDWVVKAFNDNLPYDDFLTWQLAGDLLDKPTRDQQLATAFNRIHRLNNEGGAVFEEWRIENVADRVHTFGTAIVGLTLECCRCHDHKYDPIPMRDYYALSAFFNSIDESGVYDRSQKVPCPSLLLPAETQLAELELARQRLEEAERNFWMETQSAKERWEQWIENASELSEASDAGKRLADESAIPDLRLALGFDRKFDNTIKGIYHPSQSDRSWTSMPTLVDVLDCPVPALKIELASDQIQLQDEPDTDLSSSISASSDSNRGTKRMAMALDGERGITTHGIPPFDRWRPFSVVMTLKETRRVAERSLIAHHTRGTDCGYNGWDLTIADGYLESRMYRVWPGNAIGVRTQGRIPAEKWQQVSATYDGSSLASGLKLYLDGKPLPTLVLRDELKKSCNVEVDHGGEFVVGQRFRSRGLDGGLIDDVRVYDRDLTANELLLLATGEPQAASLGYFVSAIDEPCRKALQEWTAAREAFVMVEESMDEIPVMQEQSEPRETHVLARGQYDAPTSAGTLVQRDTLSELPLPFPANVPKDRKGLAHWVTDPRHPLTARVAINRLWGNFFEAPLVRTPENFGSQGELPTHPKLLDWLARDFIDHGWDAKRFCRSVVLSATYRQDSRATEDALELDPDNRFLARGPAYRLSAEQIRDLALAASGLMNREMGGPPVSPYQPGGDLWKESNGMSPPYQQSVGQSLYRRSLYSVWKRTAPLPNMMAFDSTTREVCTVKRSRTNTPLQALVLLNDVQFVEAARTLASSVMREQSDEEANLLIIEAFVRLTGRRPDGFELESLHKLFDEERSYYAKNKEHAQELLSLGEQPFEATLEASRVAALTTVCQAILNLDATIWKR